MPRPRVFNDLTVIALDDADGPFFDRREGTFTSVTRSMWAEADRRDPACVRDGAWWLRFRCFALRLASGRVILVDTGVGPANAPSKSWAPVPGRLPEELDAAGIAPTDVDTVVLTHMHTDHIGWSLDEAGDIMFPRARYVLQQSEVDFIEAGAPALAEWLLVPLRANGQLSPVDGDLVLAPGVRIVATPGHTPGHQSVLLEGDGETLVVTGDLLVHVLQLIDPSIGYAHETDQRQARVTRTRVLAEAAARGEVILATPHLGEPFVSFAGLPARVEP